jgi:N-acetylneuraminic acid mutarotase
VPRAGHSAIIYNDSMVIFGGRDEYNNKLNDIWQFNFSSYTWESKEDGNPPAGRSGHSASLYKDMMVIFGGIVEVTKELDDM